MGIITVAPTQMGSAPAVGSNHATMQLVAEDDEVVLPSRVAHALARTQKALDRSERRVDDARYPAARRSLRAVSAGLQRVHRAGIRQMNAAPALPAEASAVPPVVCVEPPEEPAEPPEETEEPADTEVPEQECEEPADAPEEGEEPADAPEEGEESTAGPDSVVAVLTFEQSAVTTLSGLFDGIQGHPRVIRLIGEGLATAQANRNQMLDSVISLDPEGAGADYADGMADTLDGYADEVANLSDALQDDQLAPASRATLETALAGSRATSAKVTAAFGGGE